MCDENTILKAKEGDKDALEKILQDNAGLIWSIVRKFIGKGYDKEDIYQIACIGFIKAIKRFNLDFGYELSTYAVQYMIGEIKKFFRDDGIIRISRNIKESGFKLTIESMNDEKYKENICTQELFINEDEQTKLIDKITVFEMIEKLNFRERTIVDLRYFKDKTQMQVAEVLGISQVHVSRIEKKILKSFKEKLLA